MYAMYFEGYHERNIMLAILEGMGQVIAVTAITRLVGNKRVYRWYGCWLVISNN